MNEPRRVSPRVFVDCVVFELVGEDLCVLLIKRAKEPYLDQWALPGGFNEAGETTQAAVTRALTRKAGLQFSKLPLVEQLYTFDTVGRDPRSDAISIAYMALGRSFTPRSSKTTENPQFFPIKDLPGQLAYDHAEIITYAHERLASKLSYTNAVFALLPKFFTLSQLQMAYEAVLMKRLDKRNFRKKFLGLDLISPTSELFMDGAHRPARLYKFNEQQIEYLSRSFE